MKLPELILAFILPGIAVGMRRGFLSKESGIAWLLTLFGHIPGVIYALTILTAD